MLFEHWHMVFGKQQYAASVSGMLTTKFSKHLCLELSTCEEVRNRSQINIDALEEARAALYDAKVAFWDARIALCDARVVFYKDNDVLQKATRQGGEWWYVVR